MTKCMLVDGPHHGRLIQFPGNPFEIDAVPGDRGSAFIADPANLFGPHRHVYYRDEAVHTQPHGSITTYKFLGTL